MLAGEEGRSRDEQRKISSQSNVSRTSMAEARKLSAMSTAMGPVDNSGLIVPAQSMSSHQPVERRLGSLLEVVSKLSGRAEDVACLESTK